MRGLTLLLIVIGVTIALLHRIVPHSVSTPRLAMEKVIRIQDDKAWKFRDSLADDDLHRKTLDGGPHSAPSPLEALIMAQGLPCQGIVGAAPAPGGDGLFWIQCRTESGTARYRVDTRRNIVEPA